MRKTYTSELGQRALRAKCEFQVPIAVPHDMSMRQCSQCLSAHNVL